MNYRSLIGTLSTRKYTKNLEQLRAARAATLQDSHEVILQGTVLDSLIEEVNSIADKGWDLVVMIGIGGSQLGTVALYEALRHHSKTEKELLCLDTIDPLATSRHLVRIEKALADKKRLIFCFISKSGTTIESCVYASLCFNLVRTAYPTTYRDFIIVITDDHSAWHTIAISESLRIFTIPAKLGGRFSVFSAVGLVPLTLLGINTRELLAGARAITTESQLSAHALYEQAALIATSYEAGLHIHDTFVMSPHLTAYGCWYRQLMGESLGKIDTSTKPYRRVGITPTVSTATQDFHSVLQLYLAGPCVRTTSFITTSCSHAHTEKTIPITPFSAIPSLIPEKTVLDIHIALTRAVIATYQALELPHDVYMLSCSAYDMGALMQSNMMVMSLLGEFLEIDAFNQPEVALYKTKAMELLRTN